MDTARYDSPIGGLLLAARGDALVGLWLEGQKYFPQSLPEPSGGNAGCLALRKAADWLDRYFAGARPELKELTLAPAGSGFRKAVWDILCRIPYGGTATYGEIAKEAAASLGRGHMSARAVGGAVGHNPISIIIPCHRVVGSGGSLTGYAGGMERKIKLLAHEGVDVDKFHIPAGSAAP